jgi:hypothetical protein
VDRKFNNNKNDNHPRNIIDADITQACPDPAHATASNSMRPTLLREIKDMEKERKKKSESRASTTNADNSGADLEGYAVGLNSPDLMVMLSSVKSIRKLLSNGSACYLNMLDWMV